MMNKKILMIDDDSDFLTLMKDKFESENYNVFAFTNGGKALESLKTIKPDIVILDLLMPEMDGYAVLEELKKMEDVKDIPVIVLSAKYGSDDMFSVINISGIKDFVAKPVFINKLLLRVKNTIG